MNSLISVLFFLYFYLAWYGCIWLAKNGLSTQALLLLLPVGIYAKLKLKFPLRVWLRALSLGLVGIGFDYLMSGLQLITFLHADKSIILPTWLICLWLLYVGYLPVMAQLFQSHRRWSFPVGAFFGTLSYWSGEKMGMLSFSQEITPLIYFLFWGVHFSISVYILKSQQTTSQRSEV